eukprot:2650257-Prymnesium_polylepis.1
MTGRGPPKQTPPPLSGGRLDSRLNQAYSSYSIPPHHPEPRDQLRVASRPGAGGRGEDGGVRVQADTAAFAASRFALCRSRLACLGLSPACPSPCCARHSPL